MKKKSFIMKTIIFCVIVLIISSILLSEFISTQFKSIGNEVRNPQIAIYFLYLSNFFKKQIYNYYSIGLFYIKENPQKALKMFDEAIRLSEKQNDIES